PLDLGLIAALGLILVQILPLPADIVGWLSPAARTLQDFYAIEPILGWRTLSIHPAATRSAFAIALSAALMFWTAGEAFARGGIRTAVRVIAFVGTTCSIIALAQRVTAPRTIYWAWRVPDPRAVPFGPFIDRNHFATWLVLAISVVSGYLAMRVSGH